MFRIFILRFIRNIKYIKFSEIKIHYMLLMKFSHILFQFNDINKKNVNIHLNSISFILKIYEKILFFIVKKYKLNL